jgi:2-polyprenyl-3-methyl-5-hydroxy-6-metoxy-1,4-benzoquinol methylase
MSDPSARAADAPPRCTPLTSCRFCGGAFSHWLCDLGRQPLANSYVDPAAAAVEDETFPLAARVCAVCRLAQLDHVVDPGTIFRDYANFSSVSSSWRRHAERFVTRSIGRLDLSKRSFVVEVASNDGYLLRNVARAGIKCLGVEPAANVAEKAIEDGVPTMVGFFGTDLAEAIVRQHGHADLVIANNVLAHVPDLDDFVKGLARLAGGHGVVSIESPHLARLVTEVQFDTIYHEHYAYWSLHTVERVLGSYGLAVFDVERLPTQGGSLRVSATARRGIRASSRVASVRMEEACLGLEDGTAYEGFQRAVAAVLGGFAAWLDAARREGRPIAAYGAAAKGNTFLNAAGATAADIPCVADASKAKQGRLLPGSRIPVVTPEEMLATRPKEVLALPWNIADEIAGALLPLRDWDGHMVTAIPRLVSRKV